MHTRSPGINPPPGGGWPSYGFSNASGPENHLAHLKTSSVPAAYLLGWGPWILRIGSPKESISKGLLHDRSAPFSAKSKRLHLPGIVVTSTAGFEKNGLLPLVWKLSLAVCSLLKSPRQITTDVVA